MSSWSGSGIFRKVVVRLDGSFRGVGDGGYLAVRQLVVVAEVEGQLLFSG